MHPSCRYTLRISTISTSYVHTHTCIYLDPPPSTPPRRPVHPIPPCCIPSFIPFLILSPYPSPQCVPCGCLSYLIDIALPSPFHTTIFTLRRTAIRWHIYTLPPSPSPALIHAKPRSLNPAPCVVPYRYHHRDSLLVTSCAAFCLLYNVVLFLLDLGLFFFLVPHEHRCIEDYRRVQ